MIGKLLGHSLVQTTARHAHLPLHSVKTAAERVGNSRTDRPRPGQPDLPG